MKTTEINKQKLTSAMEYNFIESGMVLMYHKNSGDFSLVKSSVINSRLHQGWVECVCAENLESILGLGDTSENGERESELIYNYMLAQK